METFEAMQAALDANPKDWAVRSALADWYEEQGKPDEAKAQRRMVEQELCPELDGDKWHWPMRRAKGRWDADHDERAYYQLCGWLTPPTSGEPVWRWRYWKTRTEAEAALPLALTRLTPLHPRPEAP